LRPDRELSSQRHGGRLGFEAVRSGLNIH
jgi:hypothetical protein